MSDENDRPRRPRPSTTIDPDATPPAGAPLDALAPDPDPIDALPRGADATIRARATALKLGPHVLIWNHTEGMRVGVYREALQDADGKHVFDRSGALQWAERLSVVLVPGLTLVPAEQWAKVRPSLEERVAAGEIQSLGAEVADMRPNRLVLAISQTATEAPLRWIAEREQRGAVLQALEVQLRDVAANPGGVSQRNLSRAVSR